MNFTLAAIKEVFPHFNRIAITEEDFWRVCKRRKIIVKEMPLLINGYYERRKGRDYILLNTDLSSVQWLHTALHELCHYLLDTPGEGQPIVLYRQPCGNLTDPREQFADAFALAGLLPFPDLERLAHEDISDNPWLLNIVQDRIAVLAHYRF